jgi:hypothetical protein
MMDVSRNAAEESCAEFQHRLPQLFENKVEVSREAHLEGCDNCSELVRDLEYIAQQARLLLPIHDPAPGVWENIRTALEGESTGEATKAR